MSSSTSWTRSENKLFEQLLEKYPETDPDRWEKIASCMIDAGYIELPIYEDDDDDNEEPTRDGKWESMKRKPWTERKSTGRYVIPLLGIEEYGKGDWEEHFTIPSCEDENTDTSSKSCMELF
ncbi:hypothetical protein QQ045_016709 [Rhodiola kirilowii]